MKNLLNHWLIRTSLSVALFTTSVGFLYAADLVKVMPVTDRILLLKFDEGHIDYAVQENVNVNLFYHPLDVSAGGIYNLSRYSISSISDGEFGGGVNPINVGRKTKPDHVNSKFSTPEALMIHSVYIELPFRLKQGNVYTINVGDLADNLDEFTFAFDASNIQAASIHVNQIGFVPGRPKYAYISQWMGDFSNGVITDGKGEFPDYDGKRYDVVRVSDGASVFNGTVQFRKPSSENDGTPLRFGPWQPFNVPQNYNFSDVLEMDFSGLTAPGEYKIVVKDLGHSLPFEVSDDVFKDVYSYVLRSLFYQRAGIIQEIEPGREYPRDYHPDDTPDSRYRYYPDWRWIDSADHRAPGGFTPNGELPVWGWYHDAGDWDVYPTHGHVPLSLNIIYAVKPGNFGDGDIGNRYKLSNSGAWIDEGTNGIPDILDEARWLMEYHRRCKEVGQSRGLTTGGVPGGYGGVDGGALDGFASWQDTRNMNFSAEGPFTTYLYAAEAALYAENMDRLGRNSERDDWEAQAIDAWNWANSNTRAGDLSLWGGNVQKMRHIAALALYVRTKNTSYQTEWKNGVRDDFQYQISEEGWGNPNYWEYGGLLYSTLPSSFPGLDIAFQTEVKNKILGMAQTEYLAPHDNRGMRVAFDVNKAHFLGMQSTPMLTTLVTSSLISSDKKYEDAIHTSAAFFLGGNQEDLSWVVGLGEQSQKFSFHPNSWFINPDYNSKVYTNEQLPGYVTYGSYQNPDFINGFAADFTGDEDYAKTLLYPTYEYQNWPIMEQHIPNRYAIPGAEFTVHQNMAAAVLTYGFLSTPSTGAYTFNDRPTVTLNAPTSVGDRGVTLTATASSDTRRVAYYYEEHFIGETENRDDNFAFFWDPPLSAGTNNVVLTAVAYDDTGLISVPTSGGEKTVNIVSGGFTSVSSVSIDQGSSTSLGSINDELQLTLTFNPTNASNKTVIWSSDNNEVVNVSPSGLVKATGNGQAEVKVTTFDGQKTGIITITVGVNVPVDGVSVDPSNLDLTIGRTATLAANVTPSNASNKNVTWESLNTSVATVTAAGEVTAVNIGTAQVRVTTNDGSFQATATINVVDLNCSELVNPSFENGLAGWTLNEGTITTVPDAVDGSFSAQATGQAGMEQQFAKSLAEGTHVIVRFNAKVDSTNNYSGSGLDFKDAAGNTIQGTDVRIESTAWQEYIISANAPAGTERLNVWFFTSVDVLNVDNYCLDIEGGGTDPGSVTVTSKVASSSDDAEETISTGVMNLVSNDLDIRSADLNAARFVLNVPQGATIESAALRLIAKEANTGANAFTIKAQATDNAATFDATAGNISSRTLTTTVVSWNPSDWTAETVYTSPDIASLVQQIVNRPGWTPNNNIAFVLSASSANKRAAKTFDFSGNTSTSPELVVTYRTGAAPDTEAPSVPNGLVSSNITTSGFDVSWNSSTDNVGVTSYSVYLDAVFQQSSSNTNTSISGLSPNTDYSVTVSALDAAGNESSRSPALVVRTASNPGGPSVDIEAEDFSLTSGTTVEAGNPGFTGTGYVDYGGNNSFAEWTVDLSGTSADIVFRYANGANQNRTCDLVVNSVNIGTVDFPGTGGWSAWNTSTFQGAPITSGPNTIRLVANNSFNGGPNLDNLNITTASAGGPLVYDQDPGAAGLVSMEAEAPSSQANGTGTFASMAWTVMNDATASGSQYMIVPDNGNVSSIGTLNGPRLDFDINFVKTGAHYIWVRQRSPNGSDNSIITVYEGSLLQDWNMPDPQTSWVWSKAGTTFNVAATGVSTFSIYMREDATLIDQVLLTSDQFFDPSTGGANLRTGAVMGVSLGEFSEIAIYPNPSKNQVNIKLPRQSASDVTVLDLQGKKVIEKAQVNDQLSFRLTKGTYIVRIAIEGKHYEQKVIFE